MKRYFLILVTLFSCMFATGYSKENTLEPKEPPIDIPQGDVQVAVYYFPNWGPVLSSEWAVLKAAVPRFNGHQQPKVPMWGYTNENDPVKRQQYTSGPHCTSIDSTCRPST